MDDTLLQLGVGGIFAVLVIKEVLAWAKPVLEKRRGEGGESSGEDQLTELCRQLAQVITSTLEVARKVDDLHTWHNVRDGGGTFVWYQSGSLEKAIAQLSNSIDRQTELIRALIEIVRENQRTMDRVERRMEGV